MDQQVLHPRSQRKEVDDPLDGRFVGVLFGGVETAAGEDAVVVDEETDAVVEFALQESGKRYGIRDFSPYGYDERQYCSPGFDLAVGSLTRTPWGRYPEYHTSADNLELVTDDSLQSSLETYLEVVKILEQNRRFRNLNPKCEPQLGKRGL